MSGHVVLIGDSVFDNAAYVPGGPSVIGHLKRLLPNDWQATLVAIDGATVSTTFDQLETIPTDASHLVLSVGGNDALWTAGNLFSDSALDVRDALAKLGATCRDFADEYGRLVDKLRSLRKPLAICTVYDTVPGLEDAELAGLCVFNDTITRKAISIGAPLLDLRIICNKSSDYSSVSPIEPSASGGGKIARVILDALMSDAAQCSVFA